jgi:DNA-binding NarL/FixJ family response regulator
MSDTDGLIRVAIMDDHQGILDGYLFRLQGQADIKIVGTLRYGDDLEPLLAHQSVDVLLLDMQVPSSLDNPNPFPVLSTITRLVQLYPDMAILAISMHNQRTLIQATLDAGASGYILKEDYTAIQELASIIRSVANQGIYLSAEAFQAIQRKSGGDGAANLTPRQLEALTLCAAYPDLTTADLARRMNIAHSTLRNFLSSAYLKLGVSNRSAATIKARQLGLIPSDSAPVGYISNQDAGPGPADGA